MTATTNKLTRLTLGQMVFINSIVIIVFMTINSYVCSDGLVGGDCVKHLDNRFFLFQMTANLFFAGYYLLKIDKGKWGILTFNLLLTTIIYIIAATLHSILKAGLF
jgi:hypothetical protein